MCNAMTCDEAEKWYEQFIEGMDDPPMSPKEYRGLYGEVVHTDCYGIKRLRAIPDIVFDVGANIGTFAMFARALFPHSQLILVEPHPGNISILKRRFHGDSNVVFVDKALGSGAVWGCKTWLNTAHLVFSTEGLGNTAENLDSHPNFYRCEIQSILLHELYSLHGQTAKSYIVKLDCEGGETSVFTDEQSMDVLRDSLHFAIETHFYASNSALKDSVRDVTYRALHSMTSTHFTEWERFNVFRGYRK